MDLHGWAALATVFLVLQAFVVCLVVGIILYFLGRGITYILRELPKPFAQGRRYLAQTQSVAGRVSDRIAAPFVAARVFTARVRGLWDGLRHLFAI